MERQIKQQGQHHETGPADAKMTLENAPRLEGKRMNRNYLAALFTVVTKKSATSPVNGKNENRS